MIARMKRNKKHTEANFPFKVPQGYFDQMHQNLSGIPQQHPHKKPNIITLQNLSKHKYAWAAAATILLALTISWLAIPQKINKQDYKPLSGDEIFAMYEEGYYEIPETALILEIDVEEIYQMSEGFGMAEPDEYSELDEWMYYIED